MLYRRQKAIIGFLLTAKRKITKLELMKWAFLLRHETDVNRDPAFYDFIPYKLGPYSFTLDRELNELMRDGYIDGKNLRVNPWIFDQAREQYESLGEQYRNDISRIVTKYGKLDREKLLEYVYGEYPWYACRSELKIAPKSRRKKHLSENIIFTTGYERESVESFFSKVLQAQIETIIDVRSNPVSRKYGFSKNALKRFCAKFDIEYWHIPEVGIPSRMRENLTSEDEYKRVFLEYETEILPGLKTHLKKIEQLARNKPSVLVCFERNANYCHRSYLARSVNEQLGFAVKHI